MQVFRCIIVDDELPGLAYLRTLCEDIPFIEVVKAYNDPVKFLNEANQLDFQLCILDIEMPILSGLSLASRLDGKAIIFATAYKEYAAEAFELEAVDYITKPIKKERLEKALSRARNFLVGQEKQDQFISLNSNKGKILLRFSDIAVITTAETDRRDKTVLLKNKEEIVLKNISFEQLLGHLPSGRFCQINRKTAVALDCVLSFTHDSVITTFRDERDQALVFSLSAQYRHTFREKASR